MAHEVAVLPDASAIIDAVPMGICVVDEEMIVSFWNQWLVEWTGITRAKACGRELGRVIPELARAPNAARIRSALLRGSQAVFSAQLHRCILPVPDGDDTPRRHHCIVRPFPRREGEPVSRAMHAMLIVEDVTEHMRLIDSYRKMRDQALAELRSREAAEDLARERTRRLEESKRGLELFAHAAAHDLSAPLRRVQNLAEFLEAGESMSEDSLRDLGYLKESVSRMAALVNDLFVYSRTLAECDEFAPVSLSQEIDNVLADMSAVIEMSHASVTVDPSLAELPPVLGNATQLRRVFQNLVDNAIKYRRASDPLCIRICGSANARANGPSTCTVEVHDNGIGIDPATTETMFEPFRRLRATDALPGSGLGLALCANICERHGGSVDARPGEAGGTIFTVTLPVGAALAA